MDLSARQRDQDRQNLKLCLELSTESQDPSTRIGAVLLTRNGESIVGWNRLPVGLEPTPARLKRPLKLQLMVHAEMAAVLRAAEHGYSTHGATLYFAARDAGFGRVWGGAPCVRCAVELIAAGIQRVVSPPGAGVPHRWADDCALGAEVLREAGVSVEEVEL